jgi:phosphoserine phosphatase
MAEYWWSARRAALVLAPQLPLPEAAPAAFGQLRPLIHHGWEMVLVAAELGRPTVPLQQLLGRYAESLEPLLAHWGWSAGLLQQALEQQRQEAIAADSEAWLGLHHFYPGVVERLQRLRAEGADWAVLTTKGGAFARRILAAAGLEPWALYGHEQGSKPEVLAQLLRQQPRPLWFLEDRRPTLERVGALPELAAVRCFLASWGYLGSEDACGLPASIRLLSPQAFASPLADWP